MIHIRTPPGCSNERRYVLDIIFSDWLDMPYCLSQEERDGISIYLNDQPGEIRLPDGFFGQFHSSGSKWLGEDSLPELPLSSWDSRELADDILLVEQQVPVIFGDEQPRISREPSHETPKIFLPIDIFGSAFFMLSRYEEAVCPERDSHDRFPAVASLAFKAGFLDRPIVNEYLELLWAAMYQLWPALTRKKRESRILVSCDVDIPFFFDGSVGKAARRMGGDLLKRRSPSAAMKTMIGSWRARRSDHSLDPYKMGLDFIMDTNEDAGNAVAFYFIPENTDPVLDNSVSLDDPRIRKLLREIHDRGHEIGIHPGYNTHTNPETFARSVRTLRRVLEEERIDSTKLGGRQHYLRWDPLITPRLWNANELSYDSSLGYADCPGFRCGTCSEYPLYDLRDRRPLTVLEKPLILMESSVIADRYLGLGYGQESYKTMHKLKSICRAFSGEFSVLWHNSHMTTCSDRESYQSLIGS